MKRLTFTAATLAIFALPASALGKSSLMDSATLIEDLKAKRRDISTLTVRHVGPYVATLTTIKLDQLARLKPLHETHDEATISSAFAEIVAAEPAPSAATSESRWHLTFADKSGASVLIVTTSALAPFHGTMDGRNVLFRTNRLVHWLVEQFAPQEMSASR